MHMRSALQVHGAIGTIGLFAFLIEFSVNLPRYVIVIKPTKIISWDFAKTPSIEQ